MVLRGARLGFPLAREVERLGAGAVLPPLAQPRDRFAQIVAVGPLPRHAFGRVLLHTLTRDSEHFPKIDRRHDERARVLFGRSCQGKGLSLKGKIFQKSRAWPLVAIAPGGPIINHVLNAARRAFMRLVKAATNLR